MVKIRKPDGSEVTASIVNLYPLELESVLESRKANKDYQQPLQVDKETDITLIEPSNINVLRECETDVLNENDLERVETDPPVRSDAKSVLTEEHKSSGEKITRRPTRDAAIKFKEKIKGWVRDELV